MKFESKKDLLISITLLGLSVFLIGLVVFEVFISEALAYDYWTMILVLCVVGLLLWLYFGTNYHLSKEELKYRSGPFNGKIPLESIREIIKGKTLWVGMKPATSRKGLIIKYDAYDEIYISPKTNDYFIEKILELKPDIKITE